MSDETREEIIAELRAYKKTNTDWQQDIEKSKVVASYNNRLATMAAPGIINVIYYLSILFIPFHQVQQTVIDSKNFFPSRILMVKENTSVEQKRI